MKRFFKSFWAFYRLYPVRKINSDKSLFCIGFYLFFFVALLNSLSGTEANQITLPLRFQGLWQYV